ncbi:shikimate dehydrogenase [Capronia epimyces CBS 606.96]|uniref:Shikimate dehydrogenase n=1 Tax=Capronia epimyces CBS 606.96 TaxID=1182542 RepID=W9XFE7_9EURO|nr:shikimate dehydrogenase [Capronia epimyces CBS 606.96]EXJ78923.1 shikimate dehydrogenase [Capronia epimyces CBS 606.96]
MGPITPQNDERAFTYLVGIGVTHSVAPPMHDFIARSLGYDWKFLAQECPSVEDAVALFRKPSFAGGVVTMPYKTSIMQHLDGLDEYATTIGACNNVYRAADGSLRGTNTDWRGIKGCLLQGDPQGEGKGKPALIIGAGGASRAALFALHDQLQSNPIYVVNRDRAEVDALVKDAQAYDGRVQIIHLRSVDEAKALPAPYYIVGTVPDFEPKSPEEIAARDVVEHFLSSSAEKGVLLDMCFKPRRTRYLKLGEKHGWKTVEGVNIIGHQIQEQYRLWAGEKASERINTKGAWEVLLQAADKSPAINF